MLSNTLQNLSRLLVLIEVISFCGYRKILSQDNGLLKLCQFKVRNMITYHLRKVGDSQNMSSHTVDKPH